MTQTERIKRLFDSIGEGNLITTREIVESTGIPNPSVRRVTTSLVNNGFITRKDLGLFSKETGVDVIEEENDLHRKFIGTQKYGGDSRQFFAVTFEDNDIDREDELLAELSDFLNANYVESAGNTGYEDVTIGEAPSTGFIYPSIQVGLL